MLDLGKTLEGRYVNEGEVSMLGGQYLQSVTQTADGVGGGSLRDIYQQAAGITSQIFEAETLTRQAEKDLVQAHNIMEASRSLKKKKARHPHTNADAFFLDWLADYPDAEIEVEQVHASGCTPREAVLDADGMRADDLSDYYLAEVTGRAWQAAHEALA